MMVFKRNFFALAAIAYFTNFGLGAFAQTDDAGWVRATIDGEVMEWRLDPMQSDWFGPLDDTSTFTSGYSKLSQDGPLPSRISINVYRTQDRWRSEGMDIYLMGSGFYTTGNGDGDAKAEVSEASLDGDIMVIKGSFVAALPYQGSRPAQRVIVS